MSFDVLELPDTGRIVETCVQPHATLSQLEIRKRMLGIASSLPDRDLHRRVVAVQANNGVETLLKIFALVEAGAIPAPFPINTPKETVDECLRRLGACLYWDEEHGWTEFGYDRRHADGFEMVLHSSGSTGEPKALAIRLEAMQRNAKDVAEFLGLGADDIHLGTFSHCYMSGIYNSTILPLVTGGTTISAPQASPLSIGSIVDAASLYKPTVLWLSPLIARTLTVLRGVPEDTFADVRFVVSCTAPLPPRVKLDFEAKFGSPIVQSNGLCETLITTIERPGDNEGSGVGQIIGPQDAVRCDSEGQVIISNGAHFAGYIDEIQGPTHLQPIDPFSTGDLGHLDGQGNLHITGRLSEVINLDGVKISPEGIEAVINSLDGVSGCAIVAEIRDDGRTSLVACVICDVEVVTKLPARLNKVLPANRMPQRYVKVENLPLTDNGKLDRNRLKREIL